jgi:hypothetical protein
MLNMNFYSEGFKQETETTQKFENKNMYMQDKDCACGVNNMEVMCCGRPIYECPQERVCHRYICYEVPQE